MVRVACLNLDTCTHVPVALRVGVLWAPDETCLTDQTRTAVAARRVETKRAVCTVNPVNTGYHLMMMQHIGHAANLWAVGSISCPLSIYMAVMLVGLHLCKLVRQDQGSCVRSARAFPVNTLSRLGYHSKSGRQLISQRDEIDLRGTRIPCGVCSRRFRSTCSRVLRCRSTWPLHSRA